MRSGKKVAVVGSGPAGMAAAAQLNAAGHSVTVFERDDAPGGLLRYGIPDFKLEKWVVDRRIAIMEEEGVVFMNNTEVGKDISINDLLRQYNAIVLAGGSTIPRDLAIPGRHLKGVHFAMDFLKQQNKRIADNTSSGSTDNNFYTDRKHYFSIRDESARDINNTGNTNEPILATRKHVVIIGGGDTGSDCVGTSNRQEAKSINQFELLPKPSEERTIQMPWPTYPLVLKTSSSHEEGCERQWAVATKEFLGDDKGNLRALKIIDLEWKIGENGKASFIEVEGSAREIPCDLALLAMGFVHPQHDGLINELAVELDERGNVRASEKSYQTNIQKIFTAGDMRRGQSLVVWAISEGRECARKVDEFLMGHSVLETKDENLIAISL